MRNDFQEGDSLGIEIKNSEWDQMADKSTAHTIDILNIFQKGSWLIDLEDRNRRVNKENKNAFLIVSIFFMVSCIAAFAWIMYNKRKTRPQNHFI